MLKLRYAPNGNDWKWFCRGESKSQVKPGDLVELSDNAPVTYIVGGFVSKAGTVESIDHATGKMKICGVDFDQADEVDTKWISGFVPAERIAELKKETEEIEKRATRTQVLVENSGSIRKTSFDEPIHGSSRPGHESFESAVARGAYTGDCSSWDAFANAVRVRERDCKDDD